MQITAIKTFLVDATPKGGWGGGGRNWLFVKVETDEGISGLGEASGWPRVIQTAITDLTTILIGDDPCRIERLWQKMLLAMMGHGMTGVVGAGAMTGIEIACWDILGKKLGVPVCDLLGGRVRDSVRVYGHAGTAESAQALVAKGYNALKCGGPQNPVPAVRTVRRAVGDEIDVCVDVHGPPWFTVPDAIRVGQELEEYDILFYEDPVAPENEDAMERVAAAVNVPVSAGERNATIYGFRTLIERDIVDVIHPDTGRAGGLLQMKKIAAQAEAHHIQMAPHDGSNGPVAEAAAVHLCAAIPNFLILEHLASDVPQRYEVATELPGVNGHIAVPTAPGLGIELNEEACRAYPGGQNVSLVSPQRLDAGYVQARSQRRRLMGRES
ncbi:MAG: mandelate racemase/muconate lactonizing enzyme family protein [Chloroflexota bacterium]